MDLLKPPTDNLYKFMSITGIVIVVATTYFLKTMVFDLEEKLIDVELEQQLRQLKFAELTKRVEGMEKLQNTDKDFFRCIDFNISKSDKERFKKYEECEKTNGTTLEKVRERYDQVNELLAKHEADTMELRLSALKAKAGSEKLRHLADTLNRNLWILRVASPLGVLLSYFGFLLWYKRVQRYQDVALKAQAKTKNEEI